MRGEGAIDRRIAALATGQHGVVSRRQQRLLGLSEDAIDRRVSRGRLHVVHRGVYSVGHPILRIEGRWMAAVLAAGTNAVLSHATAATAWELRPPGTGAIHVTVPGDPGRKRRRDIRIHRSTTLTPADTTSHRGIPVTTPVRTIVDLARTLTGRPLEQALDRADHRRVIDFAELERRPLPRSLQAQLSRYIAANPTRSELEERFLALCDEHGLPRPRTNTVIEGIEVDFAWRHGRLLVEVDGYAYHRSPSAFETDRERDVHLTLAGWTVLRFTWTQITTRPVWVASAISRRLAP
jgi:very-short-patch-repair endonuclease/predicted transcriptional regulator of viral defense system